MFQWSNGWGPFPDDRTRLYFEGELTWELAQFPGHPLAGHALTAVAWPGGYDDLIVRLDGGDGFAHVRLSWTGERGPACRFLGGVSGVNRFMAAWVPVPRGEDDDEWWPGPGGADDDL